MSEQVTRITSLDQIPAIRPRIYRVTREDEILEFEWRPLTFEQTEGIRARITKPVPPLKPLEVSKRDLMIFAQQGRPTTYPDEADPEYLEQLRVYENKVSLESLRVALGWDIPFEDFEVQVKKVFVKGELDAFVDEVASASLRMDNSVMQRFLRNLNLPKTDNDLATDEGN